jgi:hypothetical protein
MHIMLNGCWVFWEDGRQVMFLPNVVLCQCTSFVVVEAFDPLFFFQNFVNSLNIICKSFQKAMSQSLENISQHHLQIFPKGDVTKS